MLDNAEIFQQTFLTSIIEHIPHMIFVKDAKELKFIRFNAAGEKLLGLSREQLIGKNDFDFFPHQQAEAFTKKDREVLENKKVFDIPEEAIDTPSGRRILHTQKIPILDGKGEPQFLLGISEDITEIKVLQAQIERAQKMETAGVLAAGVAHEFNNIFTAIMFAGGFIKENANDPALVSGCASDILQSVERAGFLTKRLLTFSNQDTPSPVAFKPDEHIRSSEKHLRAVAGSKVQLQLDLAAGPAHIHMDQKSFSQVLMSLVQNAVEAQPFGGVLTVRTASAFMGGKNIPDAEAKAGPYLLLEVEDNGVGIDEKAKASLFQPFFTTKSRAQHTGLGLSAAYGIIKKCGGFIRFDSDKSKGTTFQIYIPIEKSPELPPPVLGPISHETMAAPKTILVAEDEEAVRTMVSSALKRQKYNVIQATDGVHALELAHEAKGNIDILLTDIIMPRMSGTKLAKELSAAYPHVQIIFMSGYAYEDGSNVDAALAGHSFLSKPFAISVLLETVKKASSRLLGSN